MLSSLGGPKCIKLIPLEMWAYCYKFSLLAQVVLAGEKYMACERLWLTDWLTDSLNKPFVGRLSRPSAGPGPGMIWRKIIIIHFVDLSLPHSAVVKRQHDMMQTMTKGGNVPDPWKLVRSMGSHEKTQSEATCAHLCRVMVFPHVWGRPWKQIGQLRFTKGRFA